jgi:PD-(D/E)XK nuclease superfamily
MKWSVSAHNSMRRCQRLFVYGQVVASHNARDPLRHEAYLLKQLQSLSTWQGSIVHKVLATSFLADVRAGRPIDPATLSATAHDLARRQFAFSAARKYREPGQTKGAAGDAYCALYEHEYGEDISPEQLEIVYATITRCFEHLASQEAFLAQLAAGSAHLAELPLSFTLAGATITATLDLVYQGANGQLVVVDWKVAGSETSDYSWQLLVYALAVARCGRWPTVEADAIELYEANLLRNQVHQHPVSSQRLQEAEDFIYRSLVEREALVGRDRFDDLDLEEFEVAERPGTCYHCNFASLCLRQLEAAGRLEEVQMVQERLW